MSVFSTVAHVATGNLKKKKIEKLPLPKFWPWIRAWAQSNENVLFRLWMRVHSDVF